MLTSLLLLASLLGYSAWLRRLTSLPSAFLPLFSFSSVICLLYLGGVAGILGGVGIALAGLGLILSAAALVSLAWKRPAWAQVRLDLSPFILFFILGVLLWLKLHNAQLDDWDDFSHWGLVAKDMFANQALVRQDSIVYFKDYPPGGTLSGFFASRFSRFTQDAPVFSESLALYGQGVLILAALLTFYELARRGPRLALLLTLAVLYFAMFGFGKGFRTLNIDHMLGIFAGTILVLAWQLRRFRYRHLLLLPILMCLVLFKASGYGLALMTIVCLAAVELCSGEAKKSRYLALPALAALGLGCWATGASWNSHVASIHATPVFQPRGSIMERIHVLAKAETPVQEKIKSAFVDKLKPVRFVHPETGEPMVFVQRTSLAVLMLLLLGGYCYWRCADQDREVKSWVRVMQVGLTAGFVLYAAGLLSLYLFSFGEYEALRLASYDRYMGTWLLAWVLVMLACLLQLLDASRLEKTKGVKLALWALLVVALSNFGLENGLRFLVRPATADSKVAPAVNEVVKASKSLLPPGARVFLVWQDSNGEQLHRFRYAVSPDARVPNLSSSLGPPYRDADIWSHDISADEWSSRLAEAFDVVVIGYADDRFWSQYGGLFMGGPELARRERVFAVVGNPDGSGARLKALATDPLR